MLAVTIHGKIREKFKRLEMDSELEGLIEQAIKEDVKGPMAHNEYYLEEFNVLKKFKDGKLHELKGKEIETFLESMDDYSGNLGLFLQTPLDSEKICQSIKNGSSVRDVMSLKDKVLNNFLELNPGDMIKKYGWNRYEFNIDNSHLPAYLNALKKQETEVMMSILYKRADWTTLFIVSMYLMNRYGYESFHGSGKHIAFTPEEDSVFLRASKLFIQNLVNPYFKKVGAIGKAAIHILEQDFEEAEGMAGELRKISFADFSEKVNEMDWQKYIAFDELGFSYCRAVGDIFFVLAQKSAKNEEEFTNAGMNCMSLCYKKSPEFLGGLIEVVKETEGSNGLCLHRINLFAYPFTDTFLYLEQKYNIADVIAANINLDYLEKEKIIYNSSKDPNNLRDILKKEEKPKE